MSLRALILGALAAACLCAVTFVNNFVLAQTTLIGNSLPASIFGGLILAVALNALLHRFGKHWAFSGAELAVILAMSLTACTIPGYGLLARFASILVMPHHYARVRTDWQNPDLVRERMPPEMMVQVYEPVLWGTAKSTTPDTVVLAAVAPDAEFGDCYLRLSDSTGIRQFRRITTVDRETATVTLATPLATVAAGPVHYEVLLDNRDKVVSTYLQGAPNPRVSAQVPWHAWWRAIAFWLIAVGAVWGGAIALSLVVQRRWAEQEILPYPIAAFANSLLPSAETGTSSILKSRLFLVTTGCICSVYLLNYLGAWFPGAFPSIPLFFDFSPITDRIYVLKTAWWLGRRASIFFAVVGVAYFLSSDVAFSAGIAPILYVILTQSLLVSGISLASGDGPMMQPQMFLSFGSYLAAALMITYTGRRFYWSVVRRCFGLPAQEDTRPAEIWGMRVFLVSVLALGVLLMWVGLPLWIGIAYYLLLSLMFLVMGRIIAETGLFFILPIWLPSGVLIGLVGTHAIDGRAALVLFFLCSVLAIEPKEAIAPFLVNALRIGQLQKVKIGRLGIAIAAALVIGLAVGVPVFLQGQYQHGGRVMGGYANHTMPTHPFIQGQALAQRMQVFGIWDEQGRHAPDEAFKIGPMRSSYLVALVAGIALYLTCAIARLRFPGWPLHPVAFLIWMPWATGLFCVSFLLGWLLKAGVMRFGGARLYTTLKPLALGLIAGELLGALLPIIISFAYHQLTGELPPKFEIYP